MNASPQHSTATSIIQSLYHFTSPSISLYFELLTMDRLMIWWLKPLAYYGPSLHLYIKQSISQTNPSIHQWVHRSTAALHHVHHLSFHQHVTQLSMLHSSMINGWMGWWLHDWMLWFVIGLMYGYVEMGIWIDGLVLEWMDGWVDGWTDGSTHQFIMVNPSTSPLIQSSLNHLTCPSISLLFHSTLPSFHPSIDLSLITPAVHAFINLIIHPTILQSMFINAPIPSNHPTYNTCMYYIYTYIYIHRERESTILHYHDYVSARFHYMLTVI